MSLKNCAVKNVRSKKEKSVTHLNNFIQSPSLLHALLSFFYSLSLLVLIPSPHTCSYVNEHIYSHHHWHESRLHCFASSRSSSTYYCYSLNVLFCSQLRVYKFACLYMCVCVRHVHMCLRARVYSRTYLDFIFVSSMFLLLLLPLYLCLRHRYVYVCVCVFVCVIPEIKAQTEHTLT